MFPAKVKWAEDGKAGLEFSQHFNMERLAPAPAASKILSKRSA
jgi:hypothetical protein